ncbi:MAG: hypothetical protein EOP88_16635 [Verrucomicrobiaceae bacterium]|nr:MAG: hypothetical protein EOP88_16635 [Verrucomicrobiaceae bacterium]
MHSLHHHLMAGLALTISLTGHAVSQSFTTGRIDFGDGSSNIWSSTDIGPDGKFYALWKDGDHKNATTQITPSYKLIRYDGGQTWTQLGSFLATDIPGLVIVPGYTTLGDRTSIKVDAQGGFHIAVQGYLTSGGTAVYGYSATGASWAFTNLETTNNATNKSLFEIQLELDENDKPHVVHRVSDKGSATLSQRSATIRHHYLSGNTWMHENVFHQGLGNGGNNEVNTVSYAMGPDGKGHIAFVWETNDSGTDGSLAYTTNTGGTWSAPVKLATGATQAAAADRVSIAVDGSNKVHIIRRDKDFNLFYHTDKSGSFTNTAINGGLKGTFDLKAISANAGGDVFAVYNTQNSGTQINPGILQYLCLFNGNTTWQTNQVFAGNKASSQWIGLKYTDNRVAMVLLDHFSDPAGTGLSPSYTSTPSNPRELQFATAAVVPPAAAPSVTLPTSASVTAASATLGGTVTSDGGATITARGVVLSPTATNSSPQIGGSGVVNLTTGGTTGLFTLSAGSLTGNTAYTYRAYATNATGTTYSSSATFTTLVANAAPVIGGIAGDVTVNEGSMANKSGTFSDAQGNATATLAVTSGPGTVTQDNANGTWSWTHTPADGPLGPVQVTITATDSGTPALSNTFSFNLTVNNVAPTAIAQTGSNAVTVLEDSTNNPITLSATDPAGSNDTISYSVSALTPSSAGTLSGTAPNLTFTPAPDFSGNASFTFTASDEDSGTSAPAQVDIVVTAVNDAPTLASIANVTAYRNGAAKTVNLSGISSGPSNEASQTLLITATSSDPSVVPDPSVSYSGGSTGSLQFTPAANATGSATITVKVKDNGGTSNGGVDSTVKTFTISVQTFTYQAWSSENFTASELLDASISGPDANPDGDARVNAWEYALGTQPKTFDPEPILSLSLRTGSGATRLAGYAYTVDENAGDASLSLEVATTGSFAAVTTTPSVTPVAAQVVRKEYDDMAQASAVEIRKARLVLTLASEAQPRISELHGTRAVTVASATSTFASAPLAEPRLALGEISLVGTSSITAGANQWPSNLLAGGPAYIVITQGANAGTTTDIVAAAGGVLTLGDDLTGIASAGDRFEVRRHHTLLGLFNRTNSGNLDSAATMTAGDNVQFAKTDGTFENFFHSTASGSEGWRDASLVAENSRVVYPEQSFVLKRKAASVTTLFQQGILNSDGGTGNGGAGAPPVVAVVTGTNLVTSPADRPVTLEDLGLYTGDPATGVAPATTAANADRIIVPQPNGTQKTYFYHPTMGWITSAFQPAGNLVFPPGTAFYIIRKAPRPAFPWQTN